MEIRVFDDPVLFELIGLPVTRTMVTSLVITLLGLVVAPAIARAVVRGSSGPLAAVGELTVEWIDHLVTDIIGRPEPRVATFAGSLFLFIASCNIAGQLPGVASPTANLTTTSALAAIVFLAVPVAGIHAHGWWGYFKQYLQPNPLFLPLHMISELSRTLALSVRLFGNMLSGQLVVALLVMLVGLLVPIPMMALDLLIGLLQAYIFMILSTVYIGAAIRAGEEG